jgi:hypothetical protein
MKGQEGYEACPNLNGTTSIRKGSKVCRQQRRRADCGETANGTANEGWRRGRTLNHPDVRRGLQLAAWAWILTAVAFIILVYYFFV